MFFTLILISLAVLLVSYVVFILFQKVNKIPAKIWTFWEDDDIPKFVGECIKTWRKHNSGFEINVLTKSNYHVYVPDIDIFKMKNSVNATRVSDFMRIYLLKHHGGIWLDASIICFGSLRPLLYNSLFRDKEFIGFHIPNFNTKVDFPIIENWAFCAAPNSKFINDLYKEVLNMHDNYSDLDDYVNKIDNVDFQNIDNPWYLVYHIAIQKVIQKEKCPVKFYKMFLFNATGKNAAKNLFKFGPFYYLYKNEWNSEKAIKAVIDDKSKFASTFIKLRGIDRSVIENDDQLMQQLFKQV